MEVQKHIDFIAKLLQNIISGRGESEKLNKDQCEKAQQHLEAIQKKLDENEKHIESLIGQTDITSTGAMAHAKIDSETQTLTLDANQGSQENNATEQENKGPIKEHEDCKIIPETRDGKQVQQNKTTPAYKNQQEDKDKTKSDSLKMTSHCKEIEDLKQRVKELERQLKMPTERQLKMSIKLTTTNEALRENLQKEKEENIARNQRIEELTNRLSALAADQLTKGNPQIADLSDQCRPTKLAEGFSQIYDNQWTDVFEIFDKKKMAERDIINLLSCTIWEADRFCEKEKAEMPERILVYVVDEISNSDRSAKIDRQQKSSKSRKLSDMTKLASERYIKDLMKALAMESSQPIAQIFLGGPMKEVAKRCNLKATPDQLNTYAVEAVKLVWMMKVQQPPVELLWAKPGSRFNKEAFKCYTKMGDIVDQCIWPAVLLHKGGPVLARGVAQGK